MSVSVYMSLDVSRVAAEGKVLLIQSAPLMILQKIQAALDAILLAMFESFDCTCTRSRRL